MIIGMIIILLADRQVWYDTGVVRCYREPFPGSRRPKTACIEEVPMKRAYAFIVLLCLAAGAASASGVRDPLLPGKQRGSASARWISGWTSIRSR